MSLYVVSLSKKTYKTNQVLNRETPFCCNIPHIYSCHKPTTTFTLTRWMDGAFMDLDAESIEGEVDEYWRDLYKIQKIFNNKLKKLNAERDERERDRQVF